MAGSKLTKQEFEDKMAKISAIEPEEMTDEEKASLEAAQAMDDGTTISFEELKKSLDEYSGKLVLRIPRSLHKELKTEAEIEGVSLNQYMLYKLAK